jgi:hypothetical protein
MIGATRIPFWVWRLYWQIFSGLGVPLWVRGTIAAAVPLVIGLGTFILKPLVVGKDPQQKDRVRLGKPGEVIHTGDKDGAARRKEEAEPPGGMSSKLGIDGWRRREANLAEHHLHGGDADRTPGDPVRRRGI